MQTSNLVVPLPDELLQELELGSSSCCNPFLRGVFHTEQACSIGRTTKSFRLGKQVTCKRRGPIQRSLQGTAAPILCILKLTIKYVIVSYFRGFHGHDQTV